MDYNIEELSLKKIDIYEVDYDEYHYYVKRIPNGICYLTCQTDSEAKVIITAFYEFGTDKLIYGTADFDGATHYYLFNFLDEEKINPPIVTNNITVTEDFYRRFLKSTGQQKAFKQLYGIDGE